MSTEKTEGCYYHAGDDRCLKHDCSPDAPCIVLGCPHCLGEQKVFHKATWIGVVGSRRRNTSQDFDIVHDKVLNLKEQYGNIVLVSGGCKEGADNFAETIRNRYNIPMVIYYPDLGKLDKQLIEKKLFRAAYAKINYARNTQVADTSDILVACIAPDRKGGTEDTIKKYEKIHTGAKAILC